MSRKQCALKVEEVLRTMADMGGLYPEAVELLQQANTCQCVTCRVRCDALPQATSVYDLVKAGKSGEGLEPNEDLIPAGQDLGSTPTLYQTGYPLLSTTPQDGATKDKKTGSDKKPAFGKHDFED